VPFQERFKRKVGDNIAVVNDDAAVLSDQIPDILDAARRVQKHGFMAENDGNVPPSALRERFPVFLRAVMRVDDKTLHARGAQMLHRVSDDRAPADRQQRFGQVLRERPKSGAQPRAQNESRADFWLCRIGRTAVHGRQFSRTSRKSQA